MISWVRPSGSTIETNDDNRNVEAARLLGWKRVKLDKKEKKQKKQHSLLGGQHGDSSSIN